VTKAANSALDEVYLNVSELEARLGKCLKEREHEYDALLASTRAAMSDRVEQVIDKDFLHAAYKSKVRKAWQDEFQSAGTKAYNRILNTQEVEATLNKIIGKSLEECEQTVLENARLNGVDLKYEVTDTEALIGLAKMLSNKRRMRRFLGSNPIMHETARKLFLQSRKPLLNLRQRLKVAGFNPRAWVSAFQSPYDIYDMTAASMVEGAGPQIGLKDVILDGAVLLNVAYFVTHKSAGTVVNMALFAVLKDFTFIGDIIWEWIQDWIVEEFGDAFLQEVVTILAELATALILVTAVWRIYRYGRMAKKIVAMWNGETVLPRLREKIRLACLSTIDKAVTDARAIPSECVSKFLGKVHEQVNSLEAEICERQAWACAATPR
jgi:hypothetical protein